MKIRIIRVGRIVRPEVSNLIGELRKRLGPFTRIEELELRAEDMRDKRQAQKNLRPLYEPQPQEYLILLDERGASWRSVEFAKELKAWTDNPQIKTLTFLIGPPYGFDDATKSVADDCWSLSPLTLPSDFAQLLLWEQLYRAYTILKGMSYHHD